MDKKSKRWIKVTSMELSHLAEGFGTVSTHFNAIATQVSVAFLFAWRAARALLHGGSGLS